MLDPQAISTLVPILAAVAVGTIIFVFAYPYLSGEKQTDKRISSVTQSRQMRIASNAADDVNATRKKAVADTLKDIENRQKAATKLTLRLRLQRAGFAAEPKHFWIASLICGAIVTGITFFTVPDNAVKTPALCAVAFIGTFGLPRWVLKKLILRRQNKFTSNLANAIDVVVRGVKSGLPLNECLNIIARESPEPISGEFLEVVEQQRIGVPLSEALDRLIDRMPLAEVKFLAIVISIQQQAGGNLSEALSNLSSVLRDRFTIQLKVKALSAEAKSSAMVLSSLPPGVVGMVQITTPEYISPLWNTFAGNVIVAIGVSWMLIGVLVMRKMINFKY